MAAKLGIREGTISAGVFGAILAALVSVDQRVHERVFDLFSGGSAAPWGDRLGDLGSALWAAVRYQSLDNEPLLVFATVGALLTLFMFRS
jgi:hypothetical protein